MEEEQIFCEKCESPITYDNKKQNKGQLNEHHIIPEYLFKEYKIGKNKRIWLCEFCHRRLHSELYQLIIDYTNLWLEKDTHQDIEVIFR